MISDFQPPELRENKAPSLASPVRATLYTAARATRYGIMADALQILFFFFPQLIFAKLFNCPAFFAGCYYPRVATCCHQQPARPRSAAWHWGRRWLEKASLIGRTPAQPWDSATAPSPRRPTSRHCQQPLIKLCSLGPDVTRLVPPLLEGVTALSACSISQALSPGRPGW